LTAFSRLQPSVDRIHVYHCRVKCVLGYATPSV
jgi:hypothetical protein